MFHWFVVYVHAVIQSTNNDRARNQVTKTESVTLLCCTVSRPASSTYSKLENDCVLKGYRPKDPKIQCGVPHVQIWRCNWYQQWPCWDFSVSVGRSREPTKKKSLGCKKSWSDFSGSCLLGHKHKNPWNTFELCRFRFFYIPCVFSTYLTWILINFSSRRIHLSYSRVISAHFRFVFGWFMNQKVTFRYENIYCDSIPGMQCGQVTLQPHQNLCRRTSLSRGKNESQKYFLNNE